MRTVARLALGLALTLLSTVAAAQTFHVAPGGIASSDCSLATPCTLQRASDLCPGGATCAIVPAPGTYSQRLDVLYFKHIQITGPGSSGGVCTAPGQVVFTDGGVAGPIFSAQDHAILTLDCATLSGSSGASTGFSIRQYAIGDANNVVCSGSMVICFAASEASKFNIYTPTIMGSGSRWAYAADVSLLSIGGPMTIGDGLSFSGGFISALFGSVVGYYPSTTTGGASMSGWALQCYDGIFKSAMNIPGLPERHPSFPWMPGQAGSFQDCKFR